MLRSCDEGRQVKAMEGSDAGNVLIAKDELFTPGGTVSASRTNIQRQKFPPAACLLQAKLFQHPVEIRRCKAQFLGGIGIGAGNAPHIFEITNAEHFFHFRQRKHLPRV